MDIKLSDVHPFVRYAQQIDITQGSLFCGQRAYDNRLFYVYSGNAVIRIEQNEYVLARGDLLLWRSGLIYDLNVSGSKVTMLGINFDFLWDHHELSMPIPPGKSEFDERKILENVHFEDTDVFDVPLCLRGCYAAEEALLSILDEYRRSRILSAEICSSYARALLLCLARAYTAGERDKNKCPDEILRYISEHCAEIGRNEDLGAVFGYHPNYLSYLVNSQTGLSLHKYILKCRVMHAINLLQTTDMPVSKIAETVGFGDYNHFLKCFKKITGRTTKEFR